MKKTYYIALFLLTGLLPLTGRAQQYTGISGFIHVPSAEMNHEGDARIGIHYLNKATLPDVGFLYDGKKYDTYDYYVSLTPYSWIELSYMCTKRMDMKNGEPVYGRKDRNASVKIRPLNEGRYWPSVAIGCNDVGTSIASSITSSNTNVQLYFQNFYVAATKHFAFSAGELGVNMAFRHFTRDYNAKWNGLVGGVTFRPSFFPQARAIAEWTGNEIQLGIDALLFRHFLIQASLSDFKYFNAGICFQINLLGTKYDY